MAYILKDTIDNIRQHYDIVSVIEKYINISKAGNNYKALCPFHSEKTPSFMISPTKQIFHCFGCGVGGDVIKFVSLIENINFYEAVKLLAEDAGISINLDPKNLDREAKIVHEKLMLKRALHTLVKLYQDNLKKQKNAFIYLKNRDITEDIIEIFNIGYCNGLSIKKLSQNDIKLLLNIGILGKNNNNVYEKFKGRIIFPIRNNRGEFIGLGGRILDEHLPSAKYLNSPDSIIFKKGEIFYGYYEAQHEIRKTNKVILVEGYIDLISMHKNNIKNSIATLGTAFTQKHAKILKRLNADIFIAFDSDKAGKNAALRAAEILLNENILASIIILPKKDPDEFFKKHTHKDFLNLLSKKHSYFEVKLNIFLEDNQLDLKNIIDNEKLFKYIINLLKKAFKFSEIVYETLLNKWCDKFDFDRELVKKYITADKNTYPKKIKKRLDEKKTINKIEKEMISLILNNEQLLQEFKNMGIKSIDLFTNKYIKEIVGILFKKGTINIDELSEDAKDIYYKACLNEIDANKNIFNALILKLKEMDKKRKLSHIKEKIKKAQMNKDFDSVKRLQEFYLKIKNGVIL